MASSGVQENIIFSKTPTFDGVCGHTPSNAEREANKEARKEELKKQWEEEKIRRKEERDKECEKKKGEKKQRETSNVGVSLRIIFSHTPDEAMSDGLVKACVPGKNCSVPEKIEFLTDSI